MTNQEYIKAIEMRQSRRSYTAHLMSEEYLAVIRQLIDAANENEGLSFKLIEDASGYSKLVSGKYSAIVLCGDDTEKTRIKIGYWGETIVLQCVYHGLGTCWITGTYEENKLLTSLKLPKEERLYGIIVVGFAKPKLSRKEKLIHNINFKKNKPYQQMFEVCDKELPKPYKYAMKLVESAPSDTNRKEIHFRYESNVLSAYVDEPYSDKSIEFGIAQLHFNLGAIASGIRGHWDINGKFLEENSNIIKLPISQDEEEKGEENG